MTKRPFGTSKKSWHKWSSVKRYGLKDYKAFRIYTSHSGTLIKVK